jgi:hypothetical protein
MSVYSLGSEDNCPDPYFTPYAPRVIATSYRGYRFRSRLEARWAVFFDQMDIGWMYEPEGFVIGNRPYLPDFLLECGSWVEVKGFEAGLNKPLMKRAALALPTMPASGERGPKLLILGALPDPYAPAVEMHGDWGHLGVTPDGRGGELLFGSYGFGRFSKNRSPWWFSERASEGRWLQAEFDEWERDTSAQYAAANGARFEHGESGAR